MEGIFVNTFLIVVVGLVNCFEGNNSNPKLLFANYISIMEMDLITGVVTTVYMDSSYVYDFDYDHHRKFLYWTGNGLQRLKYPLENNSNASSLVDGYPTRSLVVDNENEHVYWTTDPLGKIMRCNLDGSNVTTILDNINRPWALAIDFVQGWMFFSSVGFPENISKVKLDGNKDQQLNLVYNATPKQIYSLVLDINRSRLYWTGYEEAIKSSNFDGSDVSVIYDDSSNHRYGIAFYKDYIYYSDYVQSKIYRIKNIHGTSAETVYTSINNMYGLFLYEEKGLYLECIQNLKSNNT